MPSGAGNKKEEPESAAKYGRVHRDPPFSCKTVGCLAQRTFWGCRRRRPRTWPSDRPRIATQVSSSPGARSANPSVTLHINRCSAAGLDERRLSSAIFCNFDRFLIGLGELHVCRIRIEYRADKLCPEQRPIVLKGVDRSLRSDAANRRIDGRNGPFLQSGNSGPPAYWLVSESLKGTHGWVSFFPCMHGVASADSLPAISAI